MKEQRCKYIIVDANDIDVILKKRERVSGFNDFWNEYTPYDSTSAKQYFEEHQIPEEFQKIAFSLPTCPCCKSDGKEVLTGRNFRIFKNRQKKEFYGEECGRWYAGDIIGGSIHFDTPSKKSTYTDVTKFYEQLAEQGYLESYIETIKSMFFIKNELAFTTEPTKIEDRAKELLKARQNKKVS